MKSTVKQIQLFAGNEAFRLDCGKELYDVNVAFTTYGALNKSKDNVVLICHALTGDSNAAGELEINNELIENIPLYSAMKKNQPGWWDKMIGSGKTIDTEKYFVISSNVLGSCYGTTGPSSINPRTGKKYLMDFPQVTVRDMVRLQKSLLNHIGVKSIKSIIGGSLGGMQALEWAIMFPEMVESIIPIATSARHSPWAISFNHIGRNAIINDPVWNNGNYLREVPGLGIARQLGMVSYRTGKSFSNKFMRERLLPENYFDESNQFQVASYLDYQGRKLINRFDANSYLIISRALDLHDVTYGRGELDEALNSIAAKTLCLGIDTDILYPTHEQKEIVKHIPNSVYAEINSLHGHDGFLIELDQLEKIIKPFLDSIE
ncbi:MAG: homoserine O-acetyltransferase [Bacteroidetes bacterium]|nr:homoserine O-acetyltransferase [Bacteroidota bacterium]